MVSSSLQSETMSSPVEFEASSLLSEHIVDCPEANEAVSLEKNHVDPPEDDSEKRCRDCPQKRNYTLSEKENETPGALFCKFTSYFCTCKLFKRTNASHDSKKMISSFIERKFKSKSI